MADKIDEIMESGHLRKLDHIGEAVPVLELFTNIWGAGAKTAQLWYQQVRHTLAWFLSLFLEHIFWKFPTKEMKIKWVSIKWLVQINYTIFVGRQQYKHVNIP